MAKAKDKVSREEIRKSALNKMPVNAIEKQYSSKSTSKAQQIVPDALIPIIAMVCTVIVMVFVVGGSIYFYSTFYGTDARTEVIEDSE